MRVVAALTLIGEALMLQLIFLVCSVPLVTMAPAAVALQRQLTDLRDARPTGVVPFLREFRRAWRQSWPLGLVFATTVAGFAVGLPFWYAVHTWVGLLFLGLLVFMLGAAGAVHLQLLDTADARRGDRWRDWIGPALAGLAARPALGLWAMMLLLTWLGLLSTVPTVGLLGLGLVPALIVSHIVGRGRRQAVGGVGKGDVGSGL